MVGALVNDQEDEWVKGPAKMIVYVVEAYVVDIVM